MENRNPAEMSNEDLEKDMEQYNREAKMAGNQEHVNKSSATEGALLTPETDPFSVDKIGASNITDVERDEDSQDGSMPDPEALDQWETEEDPNKISG